MEERIRFQIGQPVKHKILDYRGVILDVDPVFDQSEAWYETLTTNRPPKDKPWYCILVDESPCLTYVCEVNLEPDLTGKPIHNPAIDEFFECLDSGLYRPFN